MLLKFEFWFQMSPPMACISTIEMVSDDDIANVITVNDSSIQTDPCISISENDNSLKEIPTEEDATSPGEDRGSFLNVDPCLVEVHVDLIAQDNHDDHEDDTEFEHKDKRGKEGDIDKTKVGKAKLNQNTKEEIQVENKETFEQVPFKDVIQGKGAEQDEITAINEGKRMEEEGEEKENDERKEESNLMERIKETDKEFIEGQNRKKVNEKCKIENVIGVLEDTCKEIEENEKNERDGTQNEMEEGEEEEVKVMEKELITLLNPSDKIDIENVQDGDVKFLNIDLAVDALYDTVSQSISVEFDDSDQEKVIQNSGDYSSAVANVCTYPAEGVSEAMLNETSPHWNDRWLASHSNDNFNVSSNDACTEKVDPCNNRNEAGMILEPSLDDPNLNHDSIMYNAELHSSVQHWVDSIIEYDKENTEEIIDEQLLTAKNLGNDFDKVIISCSCYFKLVG